MKIKLVTNQLINFDKTLQSEYSMEYNFDSLKLKVFLLGNTAFCNTIIGIVKMISFVFNNDILFSKFRSVRKHKFNFIVNLK